MDADNGVLEMLCLEAFDCMHDVGPEFNGQKFRAARTLQLSVNG